MRIAIVETAAFGGLLHYAVQLGDGLARRGNDVDLLVPRDNEMSSHRGEARMKAVLAAPSQPSDSVPRSPFRRLLKRAGVAIRLLAAWSRVVRAVWTGRYDVVVVNSSVYQSIPAIGTLALTFAKRGAVVVGVVHNARPLAREVHEGSVRETPLIKVIRIVFSRFALVFVHGDRSRAEFEAAWPQRSVVSIPHGDERAFGEEPPPPTAEERVLFFGNWNWEKGIPGLMEAFDLLVRRREGARLTMAGRPDPRQVDLEAIHSWAERHGGAVELREGYVPMEDVHGLFGRARVVVVPYVAGYQSGVVHLAMTMGRAVVATDVGDLGSAVIDGETGFVVPPNDPVALADALALVLQDPELARRLGACGYERMMGESSWDAVAGRVEDELSALVL